MEPLFFNYLGLLAFTLFTNDLKKKKNMYKMYINHSLNGTIIL